MKSRLLRHYKYPVEEWAKLVYGKGLTCSQVVERYPHLQVSAQIIRRQLREAGFDSVAAWRRKKGHTVSYKFTNEQVREIRDLKAGGAKWSDLAVQFGCDNAHALMSMIRYQSLKNGWSWPITREVNDEQ